MSNTHLRHIKRSLKTDFNELVDMTDLKNTKPNQREIVFMSRAQAAYALVMSAKITPIVAAACVVDSLDDNGIDAIYFDNDAKVLFLVQSTWIAAGKGSIRSADVNQFVKGVEDLLNFKFECFNEKVLKQQSSILLALDDPSIHIRLILVHTGIHSLSHRARRLILDLIDDINDASNISSVVTISQINLHNAVASQAKMSGINLVLQTKRQGISSSANLHRNWLDFINRVRQAQEGIGCDPDDQGATCYFRGQRDSSWELYPSIYRNEKMRNLTPAKRDEYFWQLESDLFFEFNARARQAHSTSMTSWDVLFMMQHYSIPTRLIDWTETFGVALYFALDGYNFKQSSPPCIWILNPVSMNECHEWGDDRRTKAEPPAAEARDSRQQQLPLAFEYPAEAFRLS